MRRHHANELARYFQRLENIEKRKKEAEANKNKALEDLNTFLETGGQPFKKKDDKFLGGSMHEEGQLRTAIRQFLTTELDKGRLKLNSKDYYEITKRTLEYSKKLDKKRIIIS